MRMIFKKAIITGLLALGLLIGLSFGARAQSGTIRVDGLRLRSGPGIDYRVLTSLSKGDRVTVLDKAKGWLKIEHQGLTGYIRNRPKFIDAAPAVSQSLPKQTPPLKPSPSSAESIDSRMKQVQDQLTKITQKEKAVVEEFNAAEEALNRTRRQVRTAQAELAELERQIGRNHEKSNQLETDILTSEAYAAQRLVALYKLNWVGKVQLLATAESFFDFIRRKSALEKILGQDEELLEALHDKKVALELLLTQLHADKAQKRSVELNFQEQARQLDKRQQKRKNLLSKIRSEKTLELAALESLRQAARQLDATLQRIAPAPPAAKPRPADVGKNKPFIDYKGLLRWPVKGKIISFFGPYRDKKYAVTNFQSGINIKAERGEPIRAVSDGYTIYARWFKGFGNMMIIDHGNHYYTVYAHLEEVFKVKGDRVEKDEVIATVGDSGSMMGPALHFEVRHHGKPMDPLKWIRKG